MDRVKILAAAINVRDPLAGLARVIEVEHRRHSVHPQTVNVIFVEPKESVADEKIAHLVAAVIEDERAPILVLALARIHVLVKIGAIELGQRVRILRKMRRHPVHDHADTGLMTFVDEMAEIIGRTEPAGRCVIMCDLIPPGTLERMLGNRQQFNVRMTHLQHIRQQRVRQFEISKLAISFLPAATSRGVPRKC